MSYTNLRYYKVKNSDGNTITIFFIDSDSTQLTISETKEITTKYLSIFGNQILSIFGENVLTNTYNTDDDAFLSFKRTLSSSSIIITLRYLKKVVHTWTYGGANKGDSLALPLTLIFRKSSNGKYYTGYINGILAYPIAKYDHSLSYKSYSPPLYPGKDTIGKDLLILPKNQSQWFPNVTFQDSDGATDLGDYIEKNYNPIDENDPNTSGGDSQGGGGGGDSNIGGDTNPDDGLPDISALDSGLLTAYNPTVDELQALGRFLWSDSFDVNTFKKLFNDPFDTLLGLSIVPVAPKTSGSKNIMFGNLNSGVSAAVVSNQWVSMDMGTLHLNEVWKGALDYAPSTGVCIYLPFIGMRQLNVNDVMGSSLHLIYKFDVLTGSVIAQLYVDHDNRGNPSQGFSYTKNMGLCYEFIGQCGENIPLASQDFTNTIRAAIAGVSVAAGAAASVATGNPALGIAALTVGAANAGMQANTPTVERGGHLSGSASIMGYSQPFLIVERPHQCKPSRYYSLRGIPSQVYTSKLANCTGFTQITDNNNIRASGAQDAELEEIERLLTSGVYFPDNVRS